MQQKTSLSAVELDTYQCQMAIPGIGRTGQLRLRNASVLVTRCGGLGSAAALQLAAAGVGRLIVAHAGNIRQRDLNRQILMTQDRLGKSRVDSVVECLGALNPRLEIQAVGENICKQNVSDLVKNADVIVDCAPMMEEIMLLNREAISQGTPMVECSMYGLVGQVTTIIPGKTACFACTSPADPALWKREVRALGAVAGVVGSVAAMEAIKLNLNNS